MGSKAWVISKVSDPQIATDVVNSEQHFKDKTDGQLIRALLNFYDHRILDEICDG